MFGLANLFIPLNPALQKLGSCSRQVTASQGLLRSDPIDLLPASSRRNLLGVDSLIELPERHAESLMLALKNSLPGLQSGRMLGMCDQQLFDVLDFTLHV